MQSREDNRISAEGVVGMSALGNFLTDSIKQVQKEEAQAGPVVRYVCMYVCMYVIGPSGSIYP